MFYIQEQHKNRKFDFALIHLGPTIIVFLAFFGLTLWSAYDARITDLKNRTQVLVRNLEQTQAGITERLLTYEDILRAGAGLFYGSDNVTRKDWAEFTNVFQIEQRYPGLQGVGYAKQLSDIQIDSFVEKVRTTDLATYTINPVTQKASYAPILYIEPKSEANFKVLGYDFLSDPIRKSALEAARDSGQTTQTDKLSFAQTNSSTPQPGFLVYLPIYTDSQAPPTIAQRQQLITGYIFAKFRAQDFLRQLDQASDVNYGFEVYDGPISTETLLYRSPIIDKIASKPQAQALTRVFQVDRKTWTIRATIDPAIVAPSERNKPAYVFWGGLLFSTFVAGFIYLLLLNRTNALARKEERDITAAKDELLALASHQLRTPATGVKQYVGMLREGYAGDLTKEQMTYLDKAYASNERQLGTINDMLFVARADAGNFELKMKEFSISELVKDIAEEQKLEVEQRHQSLSIDIPKKMLSMVADPHYIRIAVENLLSNATKYTQDGGKIFVSLRDKAHGVEIIVKDSGVGVDHKDYPLLFQKFSRIPNELTDKASGSGIGLYLTQKIIHAHGGSIEFSSELGVGTSFRITLPIKRSN